MNFLKQLDNLNVTETESGGIRHYHINLKEVGSGLAWVLKGGKTVDLQEVCHLTS